MARRCFFTKKGPKKGRSYTTRGIAKKKKGIGLNITGKSKRRFVPNIQKKRVLVDGKYVRLRIAVSTLRTRYKKNLVG